jgi:hypothetical protein
MPVDRVLTLPFFLFYFFSRTCVTITRDPCSSLSADECKATPGCQVDSEKGCVSKGDGDDVNKEEPSSSKTWLIILIIGLLYHSFSMIVFFFLF